MDPRGKSVTLTCQYTIEPNSATILSRTLAPRRTGNTLPTRYDKKGKNSRSLVVHKDRQRGNLLYTHAQYRLVCSASLVSLPSKSTSSRMTGTSTSPVMAVSPWLVSLLATSSTLLKLSTTSPRIKYSTLYYHPQQHHRVLKSARNSQPLPNLLLFEKHTTHTRPHTHTPTFNTWHLFYSTRHKMWRIFTWLE